MTASTTNTKTTPTNGAKVPGPRKRAPRQPAAVKALLIPPTTLEDSARAKVAGEAIQTFANSIAAIEVLAFEGHHELIMQIARIAYTRGRQVARENGVEL
jgi:hypothetical protein